MVLIVEEFLGEELLEFKPCLRCGRGKVRFPVVLGLIHVWELKEMSKGGANHGGV